MSSLSIRSMRSDLTRDPPLMLEWKWKTQDGLHLAPSEMKTSHIYHTLCMLWHHTMPADAELHPHTRHRLGSRFTEAYTRVAVRILLVELLARDPLPVLYLTKIQQMFAYLHRNQAKLSAGPLRIAP